MNNYLYSLKRSVNYSDAFELIFFLNDILQEHDTSSLIIRYISKLILNFGFRSFQLQVWASNYELKINLENATMPSSNGDFELTKMATTKKFQGLGFGDIIIKEVIKWCRNKGVGSIVLYTQSTLFKAIKLYEKHGFVKEELNQTLYKRADVKMRLKV